VAYILGFHIHSVISQCVIGAVSDKSETRGLPLHTPSAICFKGVDYSLGDLSLIIKYFTLLNSFTENVLV